MVRHAARLHRKQTFFLYIDGVLNLSSKSRTLDRNWHKSGLTFRRDWRTVTCLYVTAYLHIGPSFEAWKTWHRGVCCTKGPQNVTWQYLAVSVWSQMQFTLFCFTLLFHLITADCP
jgi:hypothetical protein